MCAGVWQIPSSLPFVERAKGFEPSTSNLGTWLSEVLKVVKKISLELTHVPCLGDMRMQSVAEKYLKGRCVVVGYAKSLMRTGKRLDEQLISTSSICGAEVNAWLDTLSTLSLSTQKNLRREAMTLWNFAFDEGMTDAPPRGVRQIKAPLPPTEAWGLAQIHALLAAAQADCTRIGGVINMMIKDYMPCWLRIGYETGLRHGDILTLKQQEIRNSCIAKVASKTKKQLVRQISDETVSLANRLIGMSTDGSVFAWFLTRRRSFVAMKDFLDRNHVKGSSKYLRRSCATYIAMRSREQASAYLQHSSPKLLDHYVDETLIGCPEGPPPLCPG
jgi:integrase